ncbi:fungal-specific transcription factor domain-containing protein [Aspergillus recurvatus]
MSSTGDMIPHITSSATPSKGQMDSPPMISPDGTPAPARPASKAANSRRRDKPQLSCNQCRRRKSRCDRRQPCSCCSSRNQLCTYPGDAAAMGPQGPSPPASSAHDRLVHLERLVMSMMRVTRPKAVPAPVVSVQSIPGDVTTAEVHTPLDTRSECGSMRISNSELQYVGGDHWVAILDSIADVKDHLNREEQLRFAEDPDRDESESSDPASTASARPRGAFLLYGGFRPTSREEILSALPPKYIVDRYIAHYFNYLDLVSSSTAHGPSFLREYDAFWTDSSTVPIVWVGLLFSMICLACLSFDPPEDTEAEQRSRQIDTYREKIVQCLIMGQYTKAGPYVLETVINYVYVEFGTNPDAEKDMWFLLALEVNLARRMGYHRDPSHFPGISPFQGEMRRRLWATVLLSDFLISNQMGMPRMISDKQYDTSEPRNINDDNFDKDITELPPSRPETELTTALGIIARTRILKALGIVADLLSTVKPCQYSEVMQVDHILHEAAESIPYPLRMKPLAASLTDSPQLIVARLFIHHMFLKGQVMLHRRFLYSKAHSPSDAGYEYSRKTCLDASLRSLEIQHVLDEETRPGGQLHTMRWRVTSIMNHQFLTATTLLCSLLYRKEVLEREDEIRAALQRARAIWIRRSSISKEAKKAAAAVSLVLRGAVNGRSEGSNPTGCATDELEDERLAGFTGRQGGNAGMEFSGASVSAETTTSYADRIYMPDLLETLISSDLQGPDLGFDVIDYGIHSDGWTTFVDWPGSA